MAESKKPDKKRIIDVTEPGKSAPAANSKSVIVSNRPIMKDPMVVKEDQKLDDKDSKKITGRTSGKTVIQPLSASKTEAESNKPKLDKDKTIAELAEEAADRDRAKKAKTEPEEALLTGANQPEVDAEDGKPADPTPKKTDVIEAEKVKHDASVQALVESKQYFLPINAVEQRKSKRFIVLGIVFSLLLVAAWANIALDAGLIQIDGVKPLTRFFSN